MRQASKVGLRAIIQVRAADHNQRVSRAHPRSDGNRLAFAAKQDTVGSAPDPRYVGRERPPVPLDELRVYR